MKGISEREISQKKTKNTENKKKIRRSSSNDLIHDEWAKKF